MSDDDPLQRSIPQWEIFFTNRSYLTPVGHGDMSPMDREVHGWSTNPLDDRTRVIAYSKLVSAVLNRWSEIGMVCKDQYMTDPILKVADIAFSQVRPDSPQLLSEPLREQFQRLWTESPRPHDKSLCFLALNYGADFPISRAGLGLLFGQPDWSMVCVRIASKKGWDNTAMAMIQDLSNRKVDLSVPTITSFVEQGFPKLQAMKWLLLFHKNKKSVEALRVEWEAELIAGGMKLEEIYRHEP
jgi:hypothetical protein